MPLECGTIVGFESRESNVGKLRPQQSNKVESRYALANPEDLAHQALRPVTPNRAPYSARCDDAQPAAVETVWKREQGQVAAPDAETLPLNAEELPAPPNPVVPRQCTIHAVAKTPRPAVAPDTSRHGKTLPPLRAAPSQDFPAGLGAHSLAKPVGPLAPPVVWLISALHALVVPVNSKPFTREPTVSQTSIIKGTSSSSQRPSSELVPCFTSRFRLSSLVRLWYILGPRQSDVPPARFPQGVEETVEVLGCPGLQFRLSGAAGPASDGAEFPALTG